MRHILATEDYVQIPPDLYSDPFYRITYLIKEEIRKYKWTQGEEGRKLSWEQARSEWTRAHRAEFEKFLIDTLAIPGPSGVQEEPDQADKEEQRFRVAATRLSTVPYRPAG